MEKGDEWFHGLMDFAREGFLLKGQEPEPCAFFLGPDGLGICMLQVDKEYWAGVLKRIAEESQADAVAFLSTGWKGGAVGKDKKFSVMPHDDPLRQPVAIFCVKQRGGPNRLWMLPFDQVGDDGPVTWCGDKWEETEGEATSRFLDHVFES